MAIAVRLLIRGYEQAVTENGNLVATREFMPYLQDILKSGQTLHEYGAAQPDALQFSGRGPVYVVRLGLAGVQIAIRHSMRGGLMARFNRDVFMPPTRALRELMASARLRAYGIQTPEVVAIAIYKAGPLMRRTDVLTRFVSGSADLAAILGDPRNDSQRRSILLAVSHLIRQLNAAGVQHPDLNLKNVLVSSEESGYVAHILDIDRVHFHVPGDPNIARANIGRLIESLKKWRGADQSRIHSLTDGDISYLVSESEKELTLDC